MIVSYAYCEDCGFEFGLMDDIDLDVIGRYANGLFLRCSECDASIGPGRYDLLPEQDSDEVIG